MPLPIATGSDRRDSKLCARTSFPNVPTIALSSEPSMVINTSARSEPRNGRPPDKRPCRRSKEEGDPPGVLVSHGHSEVVRTCGAHFRVPLEHGLSDDGRTDSESADNQIDRAETDRAALAHQAWAQPAPG